MDEKKNYSSILVIVLTLLFLPILAYWIKACDLHQAIPAKAIIDKLTKHGMAMRFMFVVYFGLFVWLIPAKVKVKEESTKRLLLLVMILLGLIVIVGCISIEVYDLIIYPILFILYILVTVYAISSFKTRAFKTEKIFGISQENSDFYFEFNSDQGKLIIHKPQQNLWIDGGPGSGKSDTYIKSIIEQCAKRNYAGFIYDWEGDPRQEKSPILSQIAYGCIEKYKAEQNCKLNFAFINFTDMTRTVRVNVLSEKYVPRGNEALFIRDIATTLLKNLEPAWKEKTDFWANNAINYVYSVAYKCYKERDKGVNSLPHVIAICLNDSEAVFNWLSEDAEIALNMSSMLTAWKMGAHQQTAGAVSSAQTPLSMLNNKNIFWVLSANAVEEFNLDITNISNPTLLCIGNAPSIKAAVSPAISCIASVLMSQMNNPGKERSVFLVDELPTVNLQNLEVFSSTARKHHVATILAVQDFAQAERDFGKHSANILKSNCGNQFYGMTGNEGTAKGLQDMLGEIQEISESITTQDTGSGSQSESLKNEKVIKSRDIAGQRTGHFTGKVANGKPPYFSAQFDMEIGFSKEIPQFGLIVNTGDAETDTKLMDYIVQTKYEAILEEVKQLLAPYQKVS